VPAGAGGGEGVISRQGGHGVGAGEVRRPGVVRAVAPPGTTAVTVKVRADPAETPAEMPATRNTGSIGMNPCGAW
jgi:hypothetical protein